MSPSTSSATRPVTRRSSAPPPAHRAEVVDAAGQIERDIAGVAGEPRGREANGASLFRLALVRDERGDVDEVAWPARARRRDVTGARTVAPAVTCR